MSLAKNINGIHAFLIGRDKIHFEAIAEQFNLDADEVAKVAYAAEDAVKKPKPIKPQAKVPKKDNAEQKKDRKPSGYFLFTQENRSVAEELLMTKPKERKFKGKGDKIIEIKTSDFSDKGKPTLIQVGQKCASMWNALPKDEKAEWIEKAANSDPIPKKVKPAPKGKGKTNTKKKEKSESESNDSESKEDEEDDDDNKESNEDEEDAEEPDEEEEEVEDIKPKAKGKGGGRTAKAGGTQKTLPNKKLPPPKGKGGRK